MLELRWNIHSHTPTQHKPHTACPRSQLKHKDPCLECSSRDGTYVHAHSNTQTVQLCATRGLNHYRTTRRIRAANVGTHKSRNKCDDNGSKRTTDGDSEEKKMVDAPAVPLSSIRDVFVSGGGGKCMYPFVDNVEDDHAASM